MTASGAGLFQLFRPRLRALLVVALLVSLSTASSLVEPWIYRAIIDDIAGVFVAPDPLEYADRALQDVTRSLQHLPGSHGRMFNALPQKSAGAADERRALAFRTPQQAIATVLVGALLLVLVRLVPEWCALRGDIRATAVANDVERSFIMRTFRHVTVLPLSFFSLRASHGVARQVDQADEISPIVSAVSKEVWPDAFSLVVILGILVSVNWELALISMVAVPLYGLVTWRMARALDADIDRYYALWGAGKTTIADLLAGLYTPRTGAIRLDNQRLNDVSPASIRAEVRSVAADGTLFRASIRENIRYGRLDASDASVDEAAGAAGLLPLLTRLPDGLDTEIGEGGIALSAGERQRVLLGRAFVAKPRVLVLDEATANLDYRTEASVKDALAVLSRGRTTMVIAHRRSMLTGVDRVMVLRGGRIEQQGPPAELLRRPGYFHDMMRGSETSITHRRASA